jgi:hypothetical protein
VVLHGFRQRPFTRMGIEVVPARRAGIVRIYPMNEYGFGLVGAARFGKPVDPLMNGAEGTTPHRYRLRGMAFSISANLRTIASASY